MLCLPGMHFLDIHVALSKPRPGHLLSEAFSNVALSTSPCALPCLLFLHSTAMHYQGRPRLTCRLPLARVYTAWDRALALL